MFFYLGVFVCMNKFFVSFVISGFLLVGQVSNLSSCGDKTCKFSFFKKDALYYDSSRQDRSWIDFLLNPKERTMLLSELIEILRKFLDEEFIVHSCQTFKRAYADVLYFYKKKIFNNLEKCKLSKFGERLFNEIDLFCRRIVKLNIEMNKVGYASGSCSPKKAIKATQEQERKITRESILSVMLPDEDGKNRIKGLLEELEKELASSPRDVMRLVLH